MVGAEDCLHLNVYTPNPDPSAKKTVMVWIHGGAFRRGSGNKDMYGPDRFMDYDVVRF